MTEYGKVIRLTKIPPRLILKNQKIFSFNPGKIEIFKNSLSEIPFENILGAMEFLIPSLHVYMKHS